MEPQLLLASLYGHGQGPGHSGLHDLDHGANHGADPQAMDSAPGLARFDTVGVIIALLAMVGIMIAVAMMGNEGSAPRPPGAGSGPGTHLMMSTR